MISFRYTTTGDAQHMSKKQQLALAEAAPEPHRVEQRPIKVADKLKGLAQKVLDQRVAADEAEPPVDVVQQGVKTAIGVAHIAAEAGKFDCRVAMHDANHQLCFRILQVLESEGFRGSKSLEGNQWVLKLSWQ